MQIYALGDYLPTRVVDNQYFSEKTGREPGWYEALTGMRERRRAAPDENANTMAVSAVENMVDAFPGSLANVDLIIGGSYTPWDTIATIAHVVQRKFALNNARALYISSACSSFINALELAAAYFESGRSKNALIVTSEHNSLYCRDDDPISGHLWGDGAAAVLVSAEKRPDALMSVLDVTTAGLAHMGAGTDAIYCCPTGGGLVMPKGKDVFQQACREMARISREMLKKHGLEVGDLQMFVAHQANKRIIDHVAEELALPPERVANTVGTLGNTGCASAPITLIEHRNRLKRGDLVLMVVFGGGYSSGAALLRVE